MTNPSTFAGLDCRDCGAHHGPDAVGRCPDCGGTLVATYDLDAAGDAVTAGADGGSILARTGLDALLPVDAETARATGAGETPLLDAPALADEFGVGALAVKDEGSNPTGSLADREMAVAVARARDLGATGVAMPTMGNGGQAAAAAAARFDLASHAFVPSRTPFVNKAMINVHGGEMTVVEGRYADAEAAFAAARQDADWHSLAPADAPARAEGVKAVAYEIAAGRGWQAPGWVVVPTGQVTGLLGVHRGFRELEELGLVADAPRLAVAQAAGCAPVVAAHRDGATAVDTVEHPDSVCGHLEVPDPSAGDRALAALAATDGAAVAVEDDAMLAGAGTVAEAGLPGGVTAGAGVRAVAALAERGEVSADDEVVLLNPVSATKEADLMRSHLMSKGR